MVQTKLLRLINATVAVPVLPGDNQITLDGSNYQLRYEISSGFRLICICLQSALRSGNIVNNEGHTELRLLLVENFNQYPDLLA